jgi:cytoskeletal protein RodZ
MKSDLKSASSVKVGLLFSAAREELGLSVAEISQTHMINEKYIRSIESGVYDNFPSEGFARAYFLKYSELLNINPEFPSIYSSKSRKEEIVRKSYKGINDKFIKGIALCILILFIITFLFFLIKGKQNNINEIDLISTTKASSDELISQPKDEISQDFIQIPKSIPPVTKNSLEELSRIEISKTEPISEDLDENKIEILKNELELYFSEECYIEIIIGNSVVKSGKFFEGEAINVVIDKPFQITVSNAYGVEGVYNNVAVDFITGADSLNVNTLFITNE